MKIIAISKQILAGKYDTLQEVIDSNWGKLLDTLNFFPLYLPIYYDFRKLHFDGLILTGGGNLYKISDKIEDEIRDNFENSLMDFCIKRNLPIFGVCRGMQLINCYFRGTLQKIDNHVGKQHILSDGRRLNSYHNYTIDKLGNGLKIVDLYENTIESIRHISHKIFAQMSHPERNDPFSEYDVKFLKDFFDA
ncbi:MAG: gamma-glutamyl-gamma-aminobutyrate hydrolase family protein [Holosporaceae bacterium]|jgi:putative glutamine amidotransferase|nr:gamma-glutamyl-gamma-aminobutyrate hydrolase family protein [Holosporaceae bacterium]